MHDSFIWIVYLDHFGSFRGYERVIAIPIMHVQNVP